MNEAEKLADKWEGAEEWMAAASLRDFGLASGATNVQPNGTAEPDCWAILTPNGSKLVPPDEAKGRKDAYPLYTHPAQAPAPVAEERGRLRAAQAAAVMPMIGSLLDAWEGADREVMGEEPELSKWLTKINSAMESAGDEPAAPSAQAEPQQAADELVRLCPDIECGRKGKCSRLVGLSCISRADTKARAEQGGK